MPKNTDLSAVDLELALKMLSLPREIGKHPETGEPIVANFGRYGPYVAHNKQYASLDSGDEVFTVGINRAVSLLAEKKAKGGRRNGPEALRELGANPDGATIKVMKGRYGAYVSDGDTNATPAERRTPNPMTVTLEQALTLIADFAKPRRRQQEKEEKARCKKSGGSKSQTGGEEEAGRQGETEKRQSCRCRIKQPCHPRPSAARGRGPSWSHIPGAGPPGSPSLASRKSAILAGDDTYFETKRN